MTLRQQLDEDLKQAMRGGDKLRRDTLRLLRSSIHNEEIAQGKDLDDQGIQDVIAREAKRRRESIEAYRAGKREDLVAREEAELGVLLEYMPQQLSREEITDLAQQVAREVDAHSPADKGRVMKALMPQVRGRADGSLVSAVVDDLLRAGA